MVSFRAYTVQKMVNSKVRVLIRTLLPVVLFLAGVACASDPPSTQVPTSVGAPTLPVDRPESRVAKALHLVPFAFSSQVVEFADYSGSRAATGLEKVDSSEDLFPLLGSKISERLFEGVALHPHLRARTQRMNDLIEVDVFAFDLSAWSWQPGNNSPTFMLAQVPFNPEKVAGKLQELDYKEADYGGKVYYWFNEDFTVDRTNPLGLPLHRVAFLEDRIAPTSAGQLTLRRQQVAQSK